MAHLGLGLLAAVAVLVALASGAASQAPDPSSSVECQAAGAGALLHCFTYVMQGSEEGKPRMECCGAVEDALKSPDTVACLCAAFKRKYPDNPVAFNMTRAATLPAACGEDQAAFSECNSPASPGASRSEAARSPVSAFVVVAAVAAAPLLSYYSL